MKTVNENVESDYYVGFRRPKISHHSWRKSITNVNTKPPMPIFPPKQLSFSKVEPPEINISETCK